VSGLSYGANVLQWTIHNGTCSDSTSTVTITRAKQSSDPTVAAAGSSSICYGESTTLTLSGGGGGDNETVHWYSGSCGGTPAGTGNSLSVSPTATTTYYGRYEDAAPCNYNTACQSVTVAVNNDAPVISAQPANQAGCSGSTATFSVTASASGPVSYSWAKKSNAGWGSSWLSTGSGGTFRASSTANDYGDPACNGFSSAYDINCPSGNAFGIWGGAGGDEVVTRAFSVLGAGQVVSVDFDNGNVDTARKVGFSLQAAGGADVLQFYFLGGQSNYKYNDGTEHDTGIGFQRTGLRVQFRLVSASTYTLFVTPCGGSVSQFTGSYSGTMSQVKLFNQNTSGGDDHNVYFNNFIVGGYVDNADNYAGDYAGQDKGDQAIASGNGGSSYTTPMLSTSDNGAQYEVVVASCGGTVLSSAATLTVNGRPTSVVSSTDNATICGGSSTTIHADLTGTGPWNVTWSDSVQQSGVASSPATRSVSPSATTTYTVTALTDANCTAQGGDLTGSAAVTVHQLPTAPSKAYSRAPGISLKISISDLGVTAPEGGTPIFSSVSGGGQGATISHSDNYLFYLPQAGNNNGDSFNYTTTDGQCGGASGTINVNVATSEPGAASGQIGVTNGTATVIMYGIPGYQYDVQRSTDNMTSWKTLGTPPLEVAPVSPSTADGTITITDDYSDLDTLPDSAYYRIVAH
jgi:hypothetical protein